MTYFIGNINSIRESEKLAAKRGKEVTEVSIRPVKYTFITLKYIIKITIVYTMAFLCNIKYVETSLKIKTKKKVLLMIFRIKK